MSRIVWAAGEGNEAEVKTLLENGADIEAKEASQGFTALIMCGEKGHEGTARVLLERGADTEAKTAKGSTALLEGRYMVDAEDASVSRTRSHLLDLVNEAGLSLVATATADLESQELRACLSAND